MSGRRPQLNRKRGVLLVEAIVGVALIGMVLAATSYLTAQFGRSTDLLLNRSRVLLAAESQIERLRAGALPVETASFMDESGVAYRIRVSEPTDDWAPLRLVEVTASFEGKYGRTASSTMRAYVALVPENGDKKP
jgi:type II secretory pathway pseudopilin PulG